MKQASINSLSIITRNTSLPKKLGIERIDSDGLFILQQKSDIATGFKMCSWTNFISCLHEQGPAVHVHGSTFVVLNYIHTVKLFVTYYKWMIIMKWVYSRSKGSKHCNRMFAFACTTSCTSTMRIYNIPWKWFTYFNVNLNWIVIRMRNSKWYSSNMGYFVVHCDQSQFLKVTRLQNQSRFNHWSRVSVYILDNLFNFNHWTMNNQNYID